MDRRAFLSTPLLAAAQGQPSKTPLHAGFAEQDISPSIGMEQPGGYGKAFHKKFHDACKVRAAVFDNGRKRVALVGIDALVIPRGTVLAARRRIEEACRIPSAAVMIGASHSHSSGPTGMVLPGEYDRAPPLIQKLAYEKSSAADAAYLQRVEAALVRAVTDAAGAAAACRVSFGSGREDKVAFSRRFRMKNGLTYTHPGKGNPDIVKPAGPVDPEVHVIGAFSSQGELSGCIVNFCCHATTNPDGISANWIYHLEKTIRASYGPNVVVVFLQGFSGDITQVDNLSPYANPTGAEWARLVGGRVGAEAVKVLLSAASGDAAALDAASKVIRVPRRAPSATRVRRALDLVQKDPKEAGVTEWTFAKETLMLDALLRKEKEVEIEVQAIQVGPTAFLSAPGEMFCQFGLDLKARSPFRFTCPVELANGSCGYVPTEEALGRHGGGYETRLTSYSNLVPPAGRLMVDKLIAMAKKMTPGPAPEPPQAGRFQPKGGAIGPSPWTYGNVPPELS